MALVSTVYPPEVWVVESLMVLRDELVMARLVHRDFSRAIQNAGDVIHTRKPTKLSVRTWSGQTGSDADSQIEVDNLNAKDLSITLDTLVYVAYLVEDRDATITIKELREEFLIPAMDPMSQKVDDDIMSEMTSASSSDVDGNAVSAIAFDSPVGSGAAMDEDDIIEARKQLFTSQCPAAGRVMVLSSEHEADCLRSNLFVQADQSGSTEALREGRLGRKFGFDTYHSQNVPTASDTDSTAQSICFHRNALAFVNRPLIAIPGRYGAESAYNSIDDVSMRVTAAYDIRYKGVTVSFDMLYGVQLLDANLAKIINP
jgi:hypothetical protein